MGERGGVIARAREGRGGLKLGRERGGRVIVGEREGGVKVGERERGERGIQELSTSLLRSEKSY